MGARRVAPAARSRPGIRRLGRLVQELGTRETARRAGVTEPTLERWRRRGVSAAGQVVLRQVEERRQAALAEAKRRKRSRAGKLDAARRRKLEEAKARARKEREAQKRQEQRQAEEARKRAEAEREAARQVAEAQARLKRKERQEALRRAREASLEAKRQAARERLILARQEAIEKARRRAEESQRRAQALREKRAAAEKARQEAKAAAEIKKAEEREAQRAREEARRQKHDTELQELNRRLEVVRDACRLFESKNTLIAQIAGVDESTVRRWMKRPPLHGEAFDRLEQSVTELRTFLEMMKAAGEIGALPTVKTGHGERSGKRTDGVWWTRAVMRMLSPAVLKEISKWAETRHGNYPFWQVVLITSQYAVTKFDDKDREKEYKTVYFQIASLEKQMQTGEMMSERMEPSSERRSARTASDDLRRRMKKKIKDGTVKVFVHGVTVFAYRRRSRAEVVAWETKERQGRGYDGGR